MTAPLDGPLDGPLDSPLDSPTGAGAGAVDLALERGLHRRPSGEPPPLPKHLDTPTVAWLITAGVFGIAWIVLAANQTAAQYIAIKEGQFVVWVAARRTAGLSDFLTTTYSFLFTWLVPIVGWATIVLLAVFRRWRHLLVFFLSLLATVVIGGIAAILIERTRPFGVTILGRWEGFAQPSKPVTMGLAVLVGAYCSLVPPGRWRTIVPLTILVWGAVYGGIEIYLGTAHPTDELTAMLVGISVPLLSFRLFAPDQVFPITYGKRGGNTAHLDVGGERGQAIRQAVEEQLGVTVLDVKPIGAEGSAGSTPIVLKVAPVRIATASPPGTEESPSDETHALFAKLLARSHLRADRQYKLFRTLAYGRLEDENRFQTVRRLVQQEDYLGLRFAEAAIKVPKTYGIVEITPESEYLLVTDFLDGYGEIGDAEVDVELIDNALLIVRHMWDAGLAHRDIKPANLMTKGSEVAVIDVGFSQVRPTPWRQAIDLANMMLVLALRSTPELVYERALQHFTPDDIAEAFAATRSITVPSQLRQKMNEDGRDLIASFRQMAPPREPIKIQQWTWRRILLAVGVFFGAIGIVLLTITNLAATGLIP